MTQVLLAPAERSRKMHSTVLRALQDPGRQAAIAVSMGVAESTVSRYKTEQLEAFCTMLAHAGLKIVGVDRVCVDSAMYEALTQIASKAMSDLATAKRLMWEDE